MSQRRNVTTLVDEDQHVPRPQRRDVEARFSILLLQVPNMPPSATFSPYMQHETKY